MSPGVTTGSPTAWLAAVAVAAAVLLAVPAHRRWRGAGPGGPGTPRSWEWPGGAALASLACGAVVAMAVAGGPRAGVLSVVVTGLVAAGLVAFRTRARRRDADARRAHVLTACEDLVADLRAGQPPLRALERTARSWPELAQVAVAARIDADVPGALRSLARRPGADELRAVAAAWQVAHESGSGLAPALSVTVESLRQRRRTARLVATEVAAARATARLLALMPVGVLGLGGALGGDPLGFLLGTLPGLVCLVVGLLLTGLGWWWLELVAERVLAP